MGRYIRNSIFLLMMAFGIILFLYHIQLDLIRGTQLNIPECISCNDVGYRPITMETPTCCNSENATSAKIELLVLVFCEPSDISSRDIIRETWGNPREQKHGNFRVVFVIGKVLFSVIKDEASRNGDILQINVPESRRTQTEKRVYTFRWFHKECSNVKYVLNTDKNIFLNVPFVLRVIQNIDLKNAIGGHCFERYENPLTRRPISRKNRKYVASENNEDDSRWHYPAYCSGSGYLTGRDTVAAMVKAFDDTPYILMQDVYMGIIAHKTNVRIVSVPGLSVITTRYKYHHGCHCVGVVYDMKASKRKVMWRDHVIHCAHRWSPEMDNYFDCFFDLADLVVPAVVMTISGFLIVLFCVVHRKMKRSK